MNIAWSRGFFRIWLLLSVAWMCGAIWVETNPPANSGKPPEFDEASPFLKIAPDGKFFANLDECKAAAKKDPRVDLQNCTVYFEYSRTQDFWRFGRSTAWTILPPLAILFFGAAIGWALRGFRPASTAKKRPTQ